MVVEPPWGLIGGLIGAGVLLIVLLGVIFYLARSRNDKSSQGAAAPVALKAISVDPAHSETMGDVMPPPPEGTRKNYGALPRKSALAEVATPQQPKDSPHGSVYQPLSISEPSEDGNGGAYQALPDPSSSAPSRYGKGEFVDEFVSVRDL
jgi:hypothetical protein